MSEPTAPSHYEGHGYDVPIDHKDQHRDPNLAFTKAVLAFRNSGTAGQPKKSIVTTETEVVGTPGKDTSEEDAAALALEEHENRHKQRIRLARGVQHLLTGILSLAVALLQGATYVKYEQTKNVPNAWPAQPNLLPTLMLFGTAVAGVVFDICALIAYAWPQSRIGKKAFAIAIRANTLITTIKTTAYAFSTVVCRAGFNLGNSSGMNNDLWSWSCSPKGAAMNHVNNANFSCTGNTVAWGLSIGSIAIQFLGIVIDQFVIRDSHKFVKAPPAESAATPVPGQPDSGKMSSPPVATSKTATISNNGKKYARLNDDEYDQLEKITGDYHGQLESQLPPSLRT